MNGLTSKHTNHTLQVQPLSIKLSEGLVLCWLIVFVLFLLSLALEMLLVFHGPALLRPAKTATSSIRKLRKLTPKLGLSNNILCSRDNSIQVCLGGLCRMRGASLCVVTILTHFLITRSSLDILFSVLCTPTFFTFFTIHYTRFPTWDCRIQMKSGWIALVAISYVAITAAQTCNLTYTDWVSGTP